ncbi:MAG: hypothetical protein Q9198_000094, partial [Flavoplaca austrocitrina]
SSSDLSSPASPVDSTATPTVTVIVDPPLFTSSISSGVTVDPITGSSSPAINSSATATVTSVIFDPSLTGTSSSLNSTDTADGVTGSSSLSVTPGGTLSTSTDFTPTFTTKSQPTEYYYHHRRPHWKNRPHHPHGPDDDETNEYGYSYDSGDDYGNGHNWD